MKELQRRLERLLSDLDETGRARALFPYEREAQQVARNLVSLNHLYHQLYGEDIFFALTNDEAEQMQRTRRRLHELENQNATIAILLAQLATAYERLGESLKTTEYDDLVRQLKVMATRLLRDEEDDADV